MKNHSNTNLTKKEIYLLEVLDSLPLDAATIPLLEKLFGNQILSVLGTLGSLKKKGLVETIRLNGVTQVILVKILQKDCCNHHKNNSKSLVEEFVQINEQICTLLEVLNHIPSDALIDREVAIQNTKELIDETKFVGEVSEEEIYIARQILEELIALLEEEVDAPTQDNRRTRRARKSRRSNKLQRKK